jgi:hypothetical protein
VRRERGIWTSDRDTGRRVIVTCMEGGKEGRSGESGSSDSVPYLGRIRYK